MLRAKMGAVPRNDGYGAEKFSNMADSSARQIGGLRSLNINSYGAVHIVN